MPGQLVVSPPSWPGLIIDLDYDFQSADDAHRFLEGY
jgi:hypothetical protein